MTEAAGRTRRLEFRVTPAEKELIESASGKPIGKGGNDGVATYVRENEIATALHVIAAKLHIGDKIQEYSPEVVEKLFTDDMRKLYKMSPEDRKRRHEEWRSSVKLREPRSI